MKSDDLNGTLDDLLKCNTHKDLKKHLKHIHPAELGELLNMIRIQVPKGENSQQLAHPDFREPLKKLVESGNNQLNDFRKKIPNYLEGDPFIDGETE